MNEDVPSYIGRCPKCNGIVMAYVDKPEYAAEIAKAVAECIQDGYIVERVTVGYVRTHKFSCSCKEIAETQPAVQPALF